MSNNFVEPYVLRCVIPMYDFTKPFKMINGQVPRVPAGNDAVLQGMLQKVFPNGAIAVADVSTIITITAQIQSKARTGAPFTSVTLGTVDLDNTLTSETWADGTKQHFSIPFAPIDLELAASIAGEEYYLVLYALLDSGKTVTLAQTQLFIELDNVPNEEVLPVQAGNLVGNGAVYNGSGQYEITGLAVGRGLRWTKGANDTSIVNGAQTITVTATIFFTQGTTLTLHGTPGALVTAVVFNAVYPTLDEVQALVNSYALNNIFANGIWVKNPIDNLYYKAFPSTVGGTITWVVDETTGTLTP